MFRFEEFHKTYETETTDMVVSDRKFSLFLPKYLYRFLNPHDILHDFPLWAKIWRASWVLSSYLAGVPPDANKRILEIGGGVGLVSIVAATFGHQITLSEYNPDALNFARANAHCNNCPDLPIIQIDWYHPQLKTKFDQIVGSEVAYKESHLEALLKLFKSNLKPGGEIILTWEIRKSGQNLFEFFHSEFDITVSKMSLRSETTTHRIMLMKMHFKE
ncbi:MAG: methyltransferase domain-containing protein [Desulfobacterales bacterium]|jgi:predicted nicotinamide N-methyase